jgi:hypothetical protein
MSDKAADRRVKSGATDPSIMAPPLISALA